MQIHFKTKRRERPSYKAKISLPSKETTALSMKKHPWNKFYKEVL
jgi:hypothetical protein